MEGVRYIVESEETTPYALNASRFCLEIFHVVPRFFFAWTREMTPGLSALVSLDYYVSNLSYTPATVFF